MYKSHHFGFGLILDLKSGVQHLQDHLFWELLNAWFGIEVWPFSISFNPLISPLLEKLQSNNWYGISIPLQSKAKHKRSLFCHWLLKLE